MWIYRQPAALCNNRITQYLILFSSFHFFRLMFKLRSWKALEKLLIRHCSYSSQCKYISDEHLKNPGFCSQLGQTEWTAFSPVWCRSNLLYKIQLPSWIVYTGDNLSDNKISMMFQIKRFHWEFYISGKKLIMLLFEKIISVLFQISTMTEIMLAVVKKNKHYQLMCQMHIYLLFFLFF